MYWFAKTDLEKNTHKPFGGGLMPGCDLKPLEGGVV